MQLVHGGGITWTNISGGVFSLEDVYPTESLVLDLNSTFPFEHLLVLVCSIWHLCSDLELRIDLFNSINFLIDL